MFYLLIYFLSSLVTGPSFMSLSSLVLESWKSSFMRDWPEIGNQKHPCLVLPDIWRLDWVRDTKFVTNVTNEMLLSAAKCQGYILYRFWGIKGKATGGKIIPTQIRVKCYLCWKTVFCHKVALDVYFYLKKK